MITDFFFFFFLVAGGEHQYAGWCLLHWLGSAVGGVWKCIITSSASVIPMLDSILVIPASFCGQT